MMPVLPNHPDSGLYAVTPPPPAVVPVAAGGRLFPVHRIYCVGRNYADHAVEMGADPEREPPFFFAKPADAVLAASHELPYPPQTQNFHYEAELVVAIGQAGSDIPAERALDWVYGYAVGLDMTRRDLQNAAKNAGKPWDMGKGFDASAPLSAIHAASLIGHPGHARIQLSVNGALRQDSDIERMIWSVPELVARLSQYVKLLPGDLIFTGTPAGVGAVQRGDVIDASIAGIDTLHVRVV